MLTPLQAFGIVQSCLVFWEVSIGLGNSIELISLNHVQQLQKACTFISRSNGKLTSAVCIRQRRPLFNHPVPDEMLRPFLISAPNAKSHPQSSFLGGDGPLYGLGHLFHLYDRRQLRTQSTLARYCCALLEHGTSFLSLSTILSENEVTRYLVSPMATHCRLRHHYRNLLIPDVHLPRDRPTDGT